MPRIRFSEADHLRVTEAVAAAERGTSGEIVTIVTDRSDSYHDVGLHYAVGAMLAIAAFVAIWPVPLEHWLGWTSGPEIGRTAFWLVIAQAVLFLAVRYSLAWMPARMALTPHPTKLRRVRRRAVQFFRASAEHRTRGRVGVLLYVSLAEHRAEIVADAAIHGKVTDDCWGEAMAMLVAGLRRDDPAGGMADAIARIGEILAEQFPRQAHDVNELPDRLIEL
jgi:putative membrane protein